MLTGQSHLQKTENGWRVLDYEIKTSLTLNNERSPAALAAEAAERDPAAAAAQQRRLGTGLVGPWSWRFSDRVVWFFVDGSKQENHDAGGSTYSRWSVSEGTLTETDVWLTVGSLGPRWPAQLHVSELTSGTLVLEAISGETFRGNKIPE